MPSRAGEPDSSDGSAAAAAVFGAALPRVRAYAALLAGPAVQRGLLGPAEVPRLWHRHVFNSAALLSLLPPRGLVVDVGSGAGLPGMVLALARPDLDVVLVEPLLRRARFLTECREGLALERVRVLRARAEDLVGEVVADVVTARAVAPLDRLAEVALPLCRMGGHLLALKGVRACDELAAAVPTLRRLQATSWQVRHCAAAPDAPATVVDVTAGQSVRRPAGKRRR